MKQTQFIQTPHGRQLVSVLDDGTGRIGLRFVHYYPSTENRLSPGAAIRLYGEPRPAYQGGLEIIHPRIRAPLAGGDSLPKALTPVYPLGEGIQQSWLRKRIGRALQDIAGVRDLVPESATSALGLPGLLESLEYLHHPPPSANPPALADRSDPHWQRLKFDELLAQQIALRETRIAASREKAPSLKPPPGALLEARFLDSLPFELTRSQKRVWQEIAASLALEHPMHRLIQGDVGSGKTVVAALAALRAIEAGHQAALMAPTEILAGQHFRKIAERLAPLGIRVAWLTGKSKASEKNDCLEAIRTGEAQLAVGTHALIQEGVQFKNLGLAIIDEQHRFGVAQRLALRGSAKAEDGRTASPQEIIKPHLLMLSATPIPRTLAMSYLADLDISVIDELPPGRTPVVTKTIRLDRRADVVRAAALTAAQGRQVYWVCPLIEESGKLDLIPAAACAEDLQRTLPNLRVGLLHGAMPSAEKNAVMVRFINRKIDILVSTTVIEVGVDVPNATLMVIEHAERFGLSQLHQLRGRVGRGGRQSACILLFDPALTPAGKKRLKVIRESSNGFEIAAKDLEIRGPGEFLGERQSGLPTLRFADLETDGALLAAARDAAEALLKAHPDDALAHARRWFQTKSEFLGA